MAQPPRGSCSSSLDLGRTEKRVWLYGSARGTVSFLEPGCAAATPRYRCGLLLFNTKKRKHQRIPS